MAADPTPEREAPERTAASAPMASLMDLLERQGQLDLACELEMLCAHHDDVVAELTRVQARHEEVWETARQEREALRTRDGRAAGPIRNARMLAEGRPDLVVALPGKRGTADMVRRARAAGVRVVEVG